MRLSFTVLGLLVATGLTACGAPPPEAVVLCSLAADRIRGDAEQGLLENDIACLEASADSKSGVGQAIVVTTSLRAAPGGGRTREIRRLSVPLVRDEQGWRADEPKPVGDVQRDELPPGVALDPDEDPAKLAGDVPVPEAVNSWQVPTVWFALPLEPGWEVDRSWALGLADRVRLEAPRDGPGDSQDSLDARIAAAAAGVVSKPDRLERQGTVFGGAEGPHWSDETSWLLRDAPGMSVVTVTTDGLWLGSLPLAGLTAGRLHDGSLRGQLVGPLLDRLEELRAGVQRAADLSGQELFAGRLLVVADGAVPADTLHRVAFTAGQARFGDLFLLVRDDAPVPLHRAVSSLRGAGSSVVLEQEPGRLRGGRRGASVTSTDDPAGFVRSHRPAGVITTSRGVDVAAVAGLLDAAHGGSPGCVAWHAPIPEPPAPGEAPAAPPARPLPPASDVVSVLPWILPLIGEGPCSTEGRSGGGVGLAAGGPTILGTLGEDVIGAEVARHRSALRTCQRSGLARGLGEAELTVKFVVSTDGTVSSARIRSSSLGDERVEECIRERFGRMRFEPPPGGGITIVHWPLQLGR